MRKFSVLLLKEMVAIIQENPVVGIMENIRFSSVHRVTYTYKIPVFKSDRKAWTIKNALFFRAFFSNIQWGNCMSDFTI